MCFAYTTVILGQSASLSEGVCLYTGADWPKLICQIKGGERSVICSEQYSNATSKHAVGGGGGMWPNS